MPGSSKSPAPSSDKTSASGSEVSAPSEPESYSKAEIDARLAQILAAVQQQESSSSSAAAPTPGAIEKFRTTLAAEATSLLAAHRRSSQVFAAAWKARQKLEVGAVCRPRCAVALLCVARLVLQPPRPWGIRLCACRSVRSLPHASFSRSVRGATTFGLQCTDAGSARSSSPGACGSTCNARTSGLHVPSVSDSSSMVE